MTPSEFLLLDEIPRSDKDTVMIYLECELKLARMNPAVLKIPTTRYNDRNQVLKLVQECIEDLNAKDIAGKKYVLSEPSTFGEESCICFLIKVI